MSSILRIHPIILKYKNFMFSTSNEEDGLKIDITSKHIIHTSFNPKSSKGCNYLLSKIILPSTERTTNGLSLHITLNSDLTWYATIIETDNMITIEVNTGDYSVSLDNTTKKIEGVINHTLTAKIIN